MTLHTTYFGSVDWYRRLVCAEGDVYIDACENYVKQTARNRCEIATANGKQILTVPVTIPKPYSTLGENTRGTSIREVLVSEHGNWRHQHWEALKSAYGMSPFFDYYQDDIRPFFDEEVFRANNWQRLFDYNLAIMRKMLDLIGIEREIKDPLNPPVQGEAPASVGSSECGDGASSVSPSKQMDGASLASPPAKGETPASVGSSECGDGASSVSPPKQMDGASLASPPEQMDGASLASPPVQGEAPASVGSSECGDGASSVRPSKQMDGASLASPPEQGDLGGLYYQTFQRRHGFIPGLSILDLLFNEGPEAILYLKQLKIEY